MPLRGNYATPGFTLVRAPLLPVNEVLNLSSAEGQVEDALSAVARVRAWIGQALETPAIREALLVASPDLLEAEKIWHQSPESKKGRRFECAVFRYLSRMATRCTPFGLFAGVSMGTVGPDATSIRWKGLDKHLKFTRLDMEVLSGLAEALLADPEVHSRVPFRVNESLHRVGAKIVYVAREGKGSMGHGHKLASADVSEELERVLERAARPGTISELAAIFDGEEGSTHEEAEAFVEQLVQEQLLLPSLRPIISGRDPLEELIDQLTGMGLPLHADALRGLQALLSRLDAAGIGASREDYEKVVDYLRQVFSMEVSLDRLLQVDLRLAADEANANEAEVMEAIDDALEILLPISTIEGAGVTSSVLNGFVSAFLARYEERSVPLLEALDEEHGLGFGTPSYVPSGILEGVIPMGGGMAAGGQGSPLQAMKTKFLIDSATNGYEPVRLNLEALQPYFTTPLGPQSRVETPGLLNVAASNTEHGWQFIIGAPGIGAMGRFAGMDRGFQDALEAYLNTKEKSDDGLIFAEIVHDPGGRIGNILLRPRLRAKELVFLGRTDAPEGDQIRPEDLLVSIEMGRVVLRTADTGARVIPVLDNAHNVGMSRLAVYRFLHAVGVREWSGPSPVWSWGESLSQMERLPRVVAGTAILAAATWNIQLEKPLDAGELAWPEMMKWAKAFQEARKLPQRVVLAQGDHQLLVDFRNPVSVAAFLSVVGKRTRFTLEEWLGPAAASTDQAGRRMANEIAFPLYSVENEGHRQSAHPSKAPAQDLRRVFMPGSEWLYLKIYAPVSVQDEIVRENLLRVGDAVVDAGLADAWFFIRYVDPMGPHLRVRFHLTQARDVQGVLGVVYGLLGEVLDSVRVQDLSLGTYSRELERYGTHPGMMEASEAVFHADSQLVAVLAAECSPEDRWKAGVASVVWYLGQFQVPEGRRAEFVKGALNGYLNEFGLSSPEAQRPFGNFFRANKPDGLMPQGWPPSERVEEAFRKAQSDLEPWVRTLLDMPEEDRLEALHSYLHMHMNRLFYDQPRAHEMAVYAYLDRALESHAARHGRALA